MPAFTENLPRRIALRPIRWFFVLSILAATLWLLSGFVGYRLDRRVAAPPPPEGIPYARVLPSGRDSVVPGPPGVERPVFDPALTPPQTKFDLRRDEKADAWRMVCSFDTATGQFGWPARWVTWRHRIAYDVSGLRAPFPPTRLLKPVHGGTWNARTAWITTDPNEDGRRWLVSWQWARMLSWLAGIETVAASVFAIAWWVAARDSRRVRRWRCVRCRYDLRPVEGRGTCPECGFEQPTPEVLRAWYAPLRVVRNVLLTWIVLIALWIGAGVVLSPERVAPPIATSLEQIVEAIGTRGPENDGRHWARPAIESREYGWPLPVLTSTRRQVYAWFPGASPAPVPEPRRVPPLEFGGYDIKWSSQPPDPTMRSSFALTWTTTLVQLMGLQLLAWLAVLPFRKRGLSSSPSPGTRGS